VDTARLLSLGWTPEVAFDEGLARTVEWYRDHGEWLRTAHAMDVVTTSRTAEAGT
jgi:dTDP-glucose 4,6-dehydratase